MTSYGPSHVTPELQKTLSAKAKARKELLERVRRQRLHNDKALRKRLERAASYDPDIDTP